MTNTIKLKGRLRSYGTANRQGTLLTFSVRVIDKLTDEFKSLLSKRLVLHVAEDLNGHAESLQAALPLPVDETPKPVPQIITIPGQPMGKPRMTQADKRIPRPVVTRYWSWSAKARTAAKGKIPDEVEKMTARFFIEMPKSWPEAKRLQHDGKPHYDKPDIDNLCKAAMDSLIENDQIIAEISAQKFWTIDNPRTEVWFS